MADWAADGKTDALDADDKVIAGIVRHCGIALPRCNGWRWRCRRRMGRKARGRSGRARSARVRTPFSARNGPTLARGGRLTFPASCRVGSCR